MPLENRPRHADVGGVDHPAIVRRRALTGSDGLVVCLDDRGRLGDLRVRRANTH